MGSFIAKVSPCDLNSSSRHANPDLFSNKENTIEDTANMFYVAPNPAHSLITITSTEEIKNIIITSLDGKILFTGSPNGQMTHMDVAIDAYSNGIYNIIVITANGKKQIKKMVKN